MEKVTRTPQRFLGLTREKLGKLEDGKHRPNIFSLKRTFVIQWCVYCCVWNTGLNYVAVSDIFMIPLFIFRFMIKNLCMF